MPETPGEIDDPVDPHQPVDQREDNLARIRDLESRAAGADDATARAEAAERRLAFAEAGIDLSSDDERVRFFVEGYRGELTTEAIRAKATTLGVLGAGTPATEAPVEEPPDTALEEGEADLSRERRVLQQGAPPDQAPPANPYAEAEAIHGKVLAEGGQEKHALGAAFNSLANAAHRGDERVIVGRRTS